MESATISREPVSRSLRAVSPAVAIAAWAALIAISWFWGGLLNDAGARILLDAPPLFGRWDLAIAPPTLIGLATAALLVSVAPALARTAPWTRLLVLAACGALGWALALALAEGPTGVAGPLEGPSDYLASLPLIDSPGTFLSTFTDRIGDYSTHVRSHPPGMALLLWTLAWAGLGGSGWAAGLVLLVASSAVPATLIGARAIAGESAARRAAPYLVLAPAAVWIATTADALFMGVSAWAAALTMLALKAEGRRSDRLAFAAGCLFGLCFFLSFGLTLIGVIPLGVVLLVRRTRPLVIVAGTVGLVALGFLIAGFSWVDGFFAIREQYLASVASTRPYGYFLLANLAAFAIAVGPATAIGLARIRDRALVALVGAAVVAVLLADLSGMSKAEVERIWLPFLPWVMLACAALPQRPGVTRTLLAAQAALAIAVQAGVAMIW